MSGPGSFTVSGLFLSLRQADQGNPPGKAGFLLSREGGRLSLGNNRPGTMMKELLKNLITSIDEALSEAEDLKDPEKSDDLIRLLEQMQDLAEEAESVL